MFRNYNGGVRANPAEVLFTARTLRDLISSAYRVKSFQVSAPEWMSGTRYDIAAKIPAGVSASLVPEMLQSLLEERFRLAYHRTSKDFDVYVLSAAKGGVKSPQGGVKTPQKTESNKFTRTSVALPETMETLANELTGALGRPVLDQTGLNGEYMVPQDFRSLVFNGFVGQSLPATAASERAVESPSAGEIRRALQALGLRLVAGKRALPLLIVDHAEKTPTEN